MKESKANKKMIIIIAVVIIALIAAEITAAAIANKNSAEKAAASSTLPTLNPDEESTTAEQVQTSATTQTTTEKKTDYSSIEADLKKNALSFADAKMKFRGDGTKIYYADNENAASAIFRFDSSKSKKVKYIKLPSAKSYGSTYHSLVKLCEKGVIVEYLSDDAVNGEVVDYHFYACAYKGKKDISKNVNEYSSEFDGEKIYIANTEDSSVEFVETDKSADREFFFNGFMSLPNELEEYYLEQVFTARGKKFGVFCGGSNYDKYMLVYLKGKDEAKKICEITTSYYIAGKKFYYCKGGELYSINLKSKDFESKKVANIDCDVLYFVTKDRAYFCKYQGGSSAKISYIDFSDNKVKEIASGSYKTADE